ncbi:MAG: hypothetical protein K6F04_01340 [bacterium]|nr:hypothetical protein [bacterium]
MKKNNDKIIAIFENNFLSGYIIKLGFQSGKQIYLSPTEEDENTMSFSKFQNLLKSFSLNEIYSLKEIAKDASITKKLINDELRRRHKPLKKENNDLSKELKSKKEKINLSNGQTLIRASQIKEK